MSAVPPSSASPTEGERAPRKDPAVDLSTRLELLETAAGMLHAGIWERDLLVDQGWWSVEMRLLFGLEREGGAVTRSGFLSLVHPEDRDRVGTTIARLVEGPASAPARLRFAIVRPSGETRWVEMLVQVRRDAGGRAVRLAGVVIDRTELHLAGLRSAEREHRYQTVVEQAADAIFLADGDGRLVDANPAACRLVGYSREELTRLHVTDVSPPDWNQGQAPSFERLRHGETVRSERRFRRKDGTMVVGEIASQMLSDGRMEGIVRDVTEQRQAEEALRWSEAHYRNLFENAPVAIFRTLIDASLLPLDVNRRFCELVGETRERVLARTSVSWWADPAERDQFVRLVRERGSVDGFEGTVVTARGEPRRVLASATLYPEHGYLEGTIVDVTERTRQSEAVRASLREKEVLLEEVHHRVKNNLQLVSSLLNLQASKEEDPRLVALLRASQNRVAAMALVHQHLYQAGDLSKVSFAMHCRDIVESICRSHGVAPEAVEVDARDEVPLPLGVAVPCGLVLNELVTNALRHAYVGRPLGPIRVTLCRRDDGACELEVRDEGRGLPAPGSARSKSLGLTLVEKLVRQCGGVLTRESGPETGTRTRLVFPVIRPHD